MNIFDPLLNIFQQRKDLSKNTRQEKEEELTGDVKETAEKTLKLLEAYEKSSEKDAFIKEHITEYQNMVAREKDNLIAKSTVGGFFETLLQQEEAPISEESKHLISECTKPTAHSISENIISNNSLELLSIYKKSANKEAFIKEQIEEYQNMLAKEKANLIAKNTAGWFLETLLREKETRNEIPVSEKSKHLISEVIKPTTYTTAEKTATHAPSTNQKEAALS